VIALLLYASLAAASTYQLRSGTMSAAGAPAAAGQWSTNGTLGQSTPIGVAMAAADTLRAGFWYAYDTGTPTGLKTVLGPPTNRLYQNYPNPFNPNTTIDYDVSVAGDVNITVFNVRGQRITTLVDVFRAPGRYAAAWDGFNERGQRVASGIYFYRIRIGQFQDVKKMIVLK
jgi:hypothetical protein